jgi:hypothetical protein
LSDDNQVTPAETVLPPPPYSKETEDERFLQSTMDELQGYAVGNYVGFGLGHLVRSLGIGL